MRVPNEVLEGQAPLGLPIVDPIVFAAGDPLAKGGMGQITRARDRRLDREVAIKEVLDPSLRERFEREALITARLQHPAIIPIYEAGTWPNGSGFYTMRLVTGGTLQDAIAKARTFEDRLALLPHIRALTEALAYAHSRRVVHRDLKPGNVLVGEFGETVVIDWGLAKQLDDDVEIAVGTADPPGSDGSASHRPPADRLTRDLTQTGSVLGTPSFMPPEQAAGQEVDERADVYALGAILYNVLAGHPPHVDRDIGEIAAVMGRPATPIGELAPGAPADLRAIVERAMAWSAAARYPSAQQLAEELRRFEAGQLLKSREYGLRELLIRWFRRHRAVILVSLVAVVSVAIAGVVAVVGIARSEARERDTRRVAEQARAAADADNAALLEEQGRTELLAGDRGRALAYLGEAYRRGRDTVALRYLITSAARDHDLFDHAIEPEGGHLTAVGFVAGDAGGERAVVVDSGKTSAITIWSGTRREASYAVAGGVSTSWLSPDQHHVVVLTLDRQLAMYDTGSGRQLWTIDGSALVGIRIVFAPDGQRVVVVSSLKARPTDVRDGETGALVASLVLPVKTAASSVGAPATARPDGLEARAATVSPDGRRVAVAMVDDTVAIWQIGVAKPLRVWRTQGEVREIAFAGNDAVVTGGEGDVALWRLDGAPPTALAGESATIEVIAVSPDGGQIAIGDSTGSVRLWSPAGVLLGESRELRSVVDELWFSPDGTRLLGAAANNQIGVWSARSLALHGTFTIPRSPDLGASWPGVVRAAWNHDASQIVAVGSNERGARVYRTPAGIQIARFDNRESAVAGAVMVTGYRDELAVRDLATGAVRAQMADPLGSQDRDDRWISSDGHRAVVWRRAFTRVYDLTTGKRERELATSRAELGAAIAMLSPSGKWIVQGGASRGPGVRVLDAASGEIVRELYMPGVTGAAVSSDDDLLVLTFETQPAQLWKISTGEQRRLHVDGAATRARFDPSGRRVLLEIGKRAVLADIDTGEPVTTFDVAGSAAIESAAFDGSGHRLVTCSPDGAQLWDVDAHKVLIAVETVPENGAAISPDGTRFATSAEDGMIRIWDAETARLLEVIHGDHEGPALAWSSDGMQLVATYWDRQIAAIWDVHVASPAQAAQLARQAGAWMLVDGQLVPRPPAAP